jgi:hypothetical protein
MLEKAKQLQYTSKLSEAPRLSEEAIYKATEAACQHLFSEIFKPFRRNPNQSPKKAERHNHLPRRPPRHSQNQKARTTLRPKPNKPKTSAQNRTEILTQEKTLKGRTIVTISGNINSSTKATPPHRCKTIFIPPRPMPVNTKMQKT